jgi:queuine tRNA-ribosyltransferase
LSLKFHTFQRSDKARLGKIETAHGIIETPNFMPVGSKGAVKGLHTPLLQEAGAQIILLNTLHLYLRPGSERIEKLGGLHKFMGWNGPILTDSGGFQAFSLAPLKKITEEGIKFSSPIDGAKVNLTPELAIQIQEELGVDIAMVLDQLVAGDAPEKDHKNAVLRTTRWAERCKQALKSKDISMFAIVQGGIHEELRELSASQLKELDFPGYAAGGFCVGENKKAFRKIASYTADLLPEEKPRYLMGVGKPLDLVEAVTWGYDLFDCVLPTRNARNGQLFTSKGKISIKRAEYMDDDSPLDQECSCYGCKNVPKAYLNHLFRVNDPTYVLLATFHNVSFYLHLMKRLRAAITYNSLDEIYNKMKEVYTD